MDTPNKSIWKAEFHFTSIWVIKQPKQSYGKYLYSVLKEYENLYKHSPIIILGDFNIDQKLTSSYQGTNGMIQISELLNQYKIHSCYHEFYKEDFGKESKSTYFHQRKIEMPFHIDYCFLSNSMIDQNTTFNIGDEKEWLEYSDHLPLIVEIKS